MIFKGYGTVWDGEHNKPLCSFSDGKFETNDLEVARKLVDAGYKYEGDISELAEEKQASKRGKKNEQ